MRFILLFLLFIALFACKKGKILPNNVQVKYTTLNTGYVYPQGAFPLNNPSDPFEIADYPRYVNSENNNSVATYFNNDFSSLLQQNNIDLVATMPSSGYEVVITGISAVESHHKALYVDSCAFGHPEKYVYYSSLEVTVKAGLYHNGVLIETWEKKGYSTEKARNKTDDCNAPKIRAAVYDVRGLLHRVAKELRVRISKKLYELEG